MSGEAGSSGSSVFFCGDCSTRFKLRATPQGPEVAWIVLDRSVYESRELTTLYPLLARAQEDLRCPVCGTGSVKRLQPGVPAPSEPLLRETPPIP